MPINRLNAIIILKEHSNSSFEKHVGMKAGRISSLNYHNSNPTLNDLYLIKKAYPDVNLDYLVTGEGDPILTPSVYQLLEEQLSKGVNTDNNKRLKKVEQSIKELAKDISILTDRYLEEENERIQNKGFGKKQSS